MSALSVAAYAADAWVLVTYFMLARTGRARPFHWANSVGALPLLAVELLTHAYPVALLTGAFGVFAVVGLFASA